MTSCPFARKALLAVFGLALAACAREDGSRILGKWRAERLEVMSLKLPVSPELDIRRNVLAMGNDVSIPIERITQEGDEVTLDTDALIGMTFYFVEVDRMYLDLPVFGRIYYRRVHDPAVAAAVTVRGDDIGRATAAPGLARASIAPPAAPAAAPAHAQDYAQAVILVRQGDHDGALRALHDAFKLGFRDTRLLDATPEFAVLRTDVRFQALLARYAGR